MVTTQTVLLQALIEGKGYGLELAERVERRTGGIFRLSQGALYPALRGLEESGLVRSWESDPLPERGGRARRFYELTAEGLRMARQEKRGLLGLLGVGEVVTS